MNSRSLKILLSVQGFGYWDETEIIPGLLEHINLKRFCFLFKSNKFIPKFFDNIQIIFLTRFPSLKNAWMETILNCTMVHTQNPCLSWL
jgi:hypothetical protein